MFRSRQSITSYSSIKPMYYNTYLPSTFHGRSTPPSYVPWLDFEGARITPGSLMFANAFEGKSYRDTIEVMNISDKRLTIQFGKATSNAVKVKFAKKDNYLCPGLKISVEVSYTFARHMALPHIMLPICVNGLITYFSISVRLSKVDISLETDLLDLGHVDADHSTVVKYVKLVNKGSQNARFSVDLGKNELDLVVEPLKGVVTAGGETTLCVELMGSREADIDNEFWIKCEPPQRVRIIGKFIKPKLVSYCCDTCTNFTMLNFTKIYFGVKSVKTFVLENYSSAACKYCIMAEIDKQSVLYEKARENDYNFKCFEVFPAEGHLQPHQKVIIQVTYKPVRYDTGKTLEYFIGFVTLFRLSWRDVSQQEYDDLSVATRDLSTVVTSSTAMSTLSVLQDETYFAMDNFSLTEEDALSSYTSLRFCFYGEGQVAGIHTRPHTVNFQFLKLNEDYVYTFCIENASKHLPLRVKYQKTICIELDPPEFILKAGEAIELSGLFKVTSSGLIKTKIIFLLYSHNSPVASGDCEPVLVGRHSVMCYLKADECKIPPKSKPKFNMGIVPMITNEVGILTNDVRYNSDIEMPHLAIGNLTKKELSKLGSALVAFPNDRPRCLRASDPVKCVTMFAKLPRVVGPDEYRITSKTKLQLQKKNYYNKFISKTCNVKNEKNTKKIYNDDGLYKTANPYTSKMNDILDEKQNKPRTLEYTNPPFIPLTPSQLKFIEVKPDLIFLGKVAPHTGVLETFSIENMNNFPIHVEVISMKMGLAVIGKTKLLIKPNTKNEVVFVYNSTSVGRYTVPVEVCVNKSHIFEISVVAYVVSKVVQCDTTELVINPSDRSTTFLDLKNPLNSHVSFSWECTSTCFNIEPLEGCIPPKRNILCNVTYKQDTRQTDFTDVLLVSESGVTECIKIVYEKRPVIVKADTNCIEMNQIPLNIPIQKYLTLKNFSAEPASFTVVTPQPIFGISIRPTKGVIPPKGDLCLVLDIHIKAVIKFSCIICIDVERYGAIDVEVNGSVVYPSLSVQPDFVMMRKLIPYAVDRVTVKIKNTSPILCYIHFVTENLPEFMISTKENLFEQRVVKNRYTLNPGEVKILYVHFMSTEAAVYGLLLPLVVNDILGPPQLNSSASITPCHFFRTEFNHYESNAYVRQLEMPKTLPIVKLNTTVGKPVIKLIDGHKEFFYHHISDYSSLVWGDVIIENVSSHQVTLCIRLDHLKKPFTFEPEDSNCCIVDKLSFSYFVQIEPEKSVKFIATFKPKQLEFGDYTVRLPIFLKGFYEGCIFNHIILHGTYPKASILPITDTVYLVPTGIKYKSMTKSKMKVANHFGDCHITIQSRSSDINIEFQEGRSLKTGQYKVNFSITVLAMTAKVICETISICCSCGACCNLRVVGAFESSIPTAHSCYFGHGRVGINFQSQDSQSEQRSRISLDLTRESNLTILSSWCSNVLVENLIAYPLFPSEDDKLPFAVYMRKVLSVCENWVFTQGFACSRFCSIPNTFASFPDVFEKPNDKHHGTGSKTLRPALVDLILNFAGKEARQYLDISMPSKMTAKGKMLYMYNSHQNCLEFLKVQEAYLPHVDVIHMLTYQDFLLYQQQAASKDITIQSEQEFRRLSTQFWLDIVLQVFKVFVLKRIGKVEGSDGTINVLQKTSAVNLKKSKTQIKNSVSKYYLSSFDKSIVDLSILSKSEAILLSWLEHHYEQQRLVLFTLERSGEHFYELKSRSLLFFDNDLKDGIVLGAVFGSYCPYLRDQIKDMYSCPLKHEQMIHNASKLVQIWHSLKLSIDLTVDAILNPNQVEMLMLVTYMYVVFPSLSPKDTLQIKANFTEVGEYDFVIENTSDYSIGYHVLFFGSEQQYFEATNSTLIIFPRRSATLNLKFYAKLMKKVSATLVLSGDFSGKKFANNIVVNLEGIPDISSVCVELTMSGNLHELHRKCVVVQSPYKRRATYEAVVTHDPFTENVVLNKVKRKSDFSLPFAFYPAQDEFTFDEKGICNISFLVCPSTIQPMEMFIYFLSEEVGDFAAKLILETKLNKATASVLYVDLPRGFMESQCICRCKKTGYLKSCPRTLTLNIPKVNTQLWKAIEHVMLATALEEDYEFFKKYIPIPAGKRALKHITRSMNDYDVPPVSFLFQKHIEYFVSFGKKSKIRSDKSIIFDDMIGDGFMELLIHADTVLLKEKFLTLREKHNRTVRYYTVQFLPNERQGEFTYPPQLSLLNDNSKNSSNQVSLLTPTELSEESNDDKSNSKKYRSASQTGQIA